MSDRDDQGRFTQGNRAGEATKYDAATYPDQARKLCRLGATDVEIADFFEVNPTTIYEWKNVHEPFSKALTRGKEQADDRVERSLYQRAVGYDYPAVKIFMPAGAPAPVYAEYKEHHPADVGAAKMWLSNRRGEEWREKVTHGNDPDNPLPAALPTVVKIVGKNFDPHTED